MTCPNCPCPDVCRRLPAYCEWAAAEEPDPILIRHICDASRRTPRDESPAWTPPPAEESRPTATEAMRLLEAVRRCPFVSRDTACGCTGNRCGLRPPGRQVLSVQECFDCVERYG